MDKPVDALVQELLSDDRFGHEMVLPRYDGISTVNLVATMVEALGGQPGAQPLRSGLVAPALLADIRTVVFIVVDALGYDQLQYELQQANMPALASLVARDTTSYFPLTTVFPSTTSAALVSLNTGATPLEHGNAGYQAYLPQIDAIANLLFFYRADNPTLSLAHYGIDPQHWLATPNIYQRLAAAGVPSYYVNPRQFMHSPLSQMNSAGSTYMSYVAESDMFLQIRRALGEAAKQARSFIFAYWSTVDSIAHYYGTHSPEHAAEVRMLDWLLQHLLLEQVHAPGTLVVITADHGHNNTQANKRVPLDEHPELLTMMRQAPGGDARGRYLYLKPGMQTEVERYFERVLPGCARLVSLPEYLWLFGEGTPQPDFAARAGDMLLLPYSGWSFEYRYYPAQIPNPFIGKHGGLHRSEMLVPAIIFPL